MRGGGKKVGKVEGSMNNRQPQEETKDQRGSGPRPGEKEQNVKRSREKVNICGGASR